MPTSKVTVHFSCPVERVWQTVTDLSNTAWRSDLKRVEAVSYTHLDVYKRQSRMFTVILAAGRHCQRSAALQ